MLDLEMPDIHTTILCRGTTSKKRVITDDQSKESYVTPCVYATQEGLLTRVGAGIFEHDNFLFGWTNSLITPLSLSTLWRAMKILEAAKTLDEFAPDIACTIAAAHVRPDAREVQFENQSRVRNYPEMIAAGIVFLEAFPELHVYEAMTKMADANGISIPERRPNYLLELERHSRTYFINNYHRLSYAPLRSDGLYGRFSALLRRREPT